MSAHFNARWSAERIEQVRVMWADGFSAGQIARVLGGGTSRNAVIGIIHRQRLSNNRPPKSPNPNPKGPVSVRKRVIFPVQELPPDPIGALDPIPGVTIENVTHKQCRWPYGDPQEPTFHLCGHPTITLSPYCAAHARKAFAPGYVRARRDEAAEELSAIFKAERVFA